MLGEIDFASEEGDAGAVFLGFGDELEGVVGGAGTAAEDADDEVGIEGGEFFHGFGAVVDDFEEKGASFAGDPGEGADDVVVDEAGEFVLGDAGVDIGIEDLEEVAEVFAFGLLAEFLEGGEGAVVALDAVGEGDGVEAEVGAADRFIGVAIELAAFDVVDGGGAEGAGGLFDVIAAPNDPDVGGVVGAGGGGDGGVGEELFADGELFDVGGRHEHDVDEALLDDGADLGAVFLEGFPVDFRFEEAFGVKGPFFARGGDSESHVGVLGIGDDEGLA